jgi:uncharacterized integral membrane protein (TIGR00698 family)
MKFSPISNNQPIAKVLFFLLPLMVILFSWSASAALLLGLFIGLIFTNPYPKKTRVFTKYLLQVSIIGLGFGMNFTKVMEAGRDGFVFTLITISFAMGIGYLLGIFFKVERVISHLISCGTAICGGSAIAAVSQALRADDNDISVSIGTVFILNAVALFIFPPIGNYFHLSQQQFGIWSAIAIHDTSSVVGAASKYGNDALMIATTVKLARALWIIPLVILTSFIFKNKNSPWSFPWFIILFVAASLMNSYLSFPAEWSADIVNVAKVGFSITLYLIGTNISIAALKKVGARPLLQGLTLWMFILGVSLFFICKY